jgi:phosphatidylserine/phosphatidylglycerophosphate/cardiolipin synthase-like enzyme
VVGGQQPAGFTGPLHQLEPLAGLVEAADETATILTRLNMAIAAGDAKGLPELFPDSRTAASCLRYAGILDANGNLLPGAHDRLIELRTLMALQGGPANRWAPVMTVPPFLRRALPEGSVLETLPVVRRLVTGARRRLLIASPFLDSSFAALVPAIARFVGNGGQCLLITRDLLEEGPAGRNRGIVNRLRSAVADAGSEVGRLEVVSWEEVGLGIHMKVLVADSGAAYVGSANLTWGGLGDHAEIGIYLEGSPVIEIERLIEAVAVTLRERRGWRAR